MEYKIEKGIPVPRPLSGPAVRKYPFLDMERGDSVFFPHESHHSPCGQPTFLGALHHAKKKAVGNTFITRTVTERGVKGWRVFCVAKEPEAIAAE